MLGGELLGGLQVERGREGAVPAGPQARRAGRRLQGALAAAPGGDNRAERAPEPEREPEPELHRAVQSWG